MIMSSNTKMNVDDYSAIFDKQENPRVFSFKIYYCNIEWGKIIVNTIGNTVRYTGKDIKSNITEQLFEKCLDDAKMLASIYNLDNNIKWFVTFYGTEKDCYIFSVYITNYDGFPTTCLAGQFMTDIPDNNGNFSHYYSGLRFPQEDFVSMLNIIKDKVMFIQKAD